MVGRNDPCPCGSGKKYKKCCMNVTPSTLSATDAIEKMIAESGYPENVTEVLLNLFRYLFIKRLQGACYAFNSVLYIALSELGYNPQLCYGEVGNNRNTINHCWVELNGTVIDAAYHISLLHRLQEQQQTFTPVVKVEDIERLKQPSEQFGITVRGLDSVSMQFANEPFSKYMDNYQLEKNGLWGVLAKIMPNENVDIDVLRKKYANVERVYRH